MTYAATVSTAGQLIAGQADWNGIAPEAVARISAAVACAILRISAGSRIAPRPTLCGNSVAPTILLWPWTASVLAT